MSAQSRENYVKVTPNPKGVVNRVMQPDDSNPNAAEPARLDDIMSAEELLMLDAIVVGRGGGIRIYEVCNAPEACLFDKEACTTLPSSISYSLRQSVVVQVEKHALSVSKYPAQTLVLAVPMNSIQRIVSFDSPDGTGVRYNCANGFYFSFLLEDVQKRLLLIKLAIANQVQQLPQCFEHMNIPRRGPSARRAASPGSLEGHIILTRRAQSAPKDKTPQASPSRMKSVSPLDAEKAVKREELIRHVAAQRRLEYAEQHRPTDVMPSKHDVVAAKEKAERRKQLEKRLEQERTKRKQGYAKV